MLSDANLIFQDPVKVTTAINDAKEIFGENTPYSIEHRLGEDIVVFNKHFTDTVKIALTNGCMAKMNAAEVTLLQAYISFVEGTELRDITESGNDVLKALDEWLVLDVAGIHHVEVNDCYQ